MLEEKEEEDQIQAKSWKWRPRGGRRKGWPMRFNPTQRRTKPASTKHKAPEKITKEEARTLDRAGSPAGGERAAMRGRTTRGRRLGGTSSSSGADRARVDEETNIETTAVGDRPQGHNR